MSKANILFFVSVLFLACKPKTKLVYSAPENKSTYDKERGIKKAESNETLVEINTPYGKMLARLFNQTPLHRDNFIELVEKGFYDSLLFHRVIQNFMIQGGDPDSKYAKDAQLLGDGDLNYMVQAEFKKELFHKKGMLCAARESDDKNPQKASSACQFYIVQGKVLSDKDIKQYEYRINRPLIKEITAQILEDSSYLTLKKRRAFYQEKNMVDSLKQLNSTIDSLTYAEYEKRAHYTFSTEQIAAYKSIGGTPHLDGSYTVFGEIIEGMEVIDKIAKVATDGNDRPLQNIRMSMKILRKAKEKGAK